MPSPTRHIPAAAAATLALVLAALPVLAGSLAASSAAGGSSASSASSASSEASSDSSSRRQKAAAGPYRITTLAALDGQAGLVRLQLQALAADAPEPQHVLVLPQAVVAEHGLLAGQTVHARPQAYGTEFLRADSQQAFFLVLADGWQRELGANPVRL